MKIQFSSRNVALALGALALLGGSLMTAPARAQDTAAGAAPDKTVTLNLRNVPIQTALQVLFKDAGISQYKIAQEIQGMTGTVNIKDVPFSSALNQLLENATPKAAFTVDNGVYNVTVKRAAPAPPTTVERTAVETAGSASGNGGKVYGVIPINKYDAYIIAELLGAQGIVPVPSNEVMGSQSSQQVGQQGGYGGQQGGYGGQQGGFGRTGSSFGGQQGGFGGTGGFGGQQGGGYGGGGRGGYGGGGGGYGGGRPFSLIVPQ